MTQFLALDKCLLPRRPYLAILHVPVTDEKQASDDTKLEYDLEWLAILRKTHHLSAATRMQRMNVPPYMHHAVTDADIAWVRDRLLPLEETLRFRKTLK